MGGKNKEKKDKSQFYIKSCEKERRNNIKRSAKALELTDARTCLNNWKKTVQRISKKKEKRKGKNKSTLNLLRN